MMMTIFTENLRMPEIYQKPRKRIKIKMILKNSLYVIQNIFKVNIIFYADYLQMIAALGHIL